MLLDGVEGGGRAKEKKSVGVGIRSSIIEEKRMSDRGERQAHKTQNDTREFRQLLAGWTERPDYNYEVRC